MDYKTEISKRESYKPNVLPTIIDGDAYLDERLNSGKPFSLGKIGGTEGKIMAFMSKRIHRIIRPDKRRRYMTDLYYLSGVYPNNKVTMYAFYNFWKDHVFPNADTLCHWGGEADYYIDQKFKLTANYITRHHFNIGGNAQWPKHLNGKRILLISPFKDSIERQFPSLKKIWGEHLDLTNLELAGVIRAPHYAHLEEPSTANWFIALGYLWGQTLAYQYDVLIIGAGAWGLPLANMAKRAGRIGIHMGGETQLLFGIKGRRWVDPNGTPPDFVNKHWIYPLESDTPKDFSKASRHFKTDNLYWR